jgi:hypothetical protein
MVTVVSGTDCTVIEPMANETRPTTIASGDYWLDTDTATFYFSEADKGTTVTINYHTYTQPQTPSYIYTETLTISTNTTNDYTSTGAAFKTDIADTYASGTYAKTCIVNGQSLTYTALTPTVNQYGLTTDGGCLVFLFYLDNAGKTATITINKNTTLINTDIGNWAIAPDFVDWGNKQDKIRIKDETGFYIDKYKTLIVGTSIVCDYTNIVWNAEKPTVSYYVYQGEAAVTLAAGDVLAEHGKGLIYITKTAMDSIASNLQSLKQNYLCWAV